MYGRVLKVLFRLNKSSFSGNTQKSKVWQLFQVVIIIRKPQQMFSYACNLLKMDASSTDFQQCFKKYLPRNPINTSRSDQITTG